MKMNEDFVLTQTKTVEMSMNKTIVTCTEKLEVLDAFGRKKVVQEDKKEKTIFHNTERRWCA